MVVPSRHDAPIGSARAPFYVDIASAIPAVSKRVDGVVGTGKSDRIDQSTMPFAFGEAGCLQMTQDVAKASLIPNLFQTSDKGTVSALMLTN